MVVCVCVFVVVVGAVAGRPVDWSLGGTAGRSVGRPVGRSVARLCECLVFVSVSELCSVRLGAYGSLCVCSVVCGCLSCVRV